MHSKIRRQQRVSELTFLSDSTLNTLAIRLDRGIVISFSNCPPYFSAISSSDKLTLSVCSRLCVLSTRCW